MKITVLGGAGFVGSALVPNLLNAGHKITVLDTFWFGDKLPPDHPYLTKIKADMRDIHALRKALHEAETVIHLACISNDPSFDLNPALGKSINLEAFPKVLAACEVARVKRFIYASSSSVYGIKKEEQVTEALSCEPLTDYSKFKLECEEILKHSDIPEWTIVRPATVCGYAPRLRLDLVVNILTANALVNGEIIVNGGDQCRPGIYIKDMVRVYESLLKAGPDKVHGQTFNAGFDNKTVMEIAETIKEHLGNPDVKITVKPVIDGRSYRINSDKLIHSLDFKPRHTIERAVTSLKMAFANLKDPLNNPDYHNIKKMKELQIEG